MQLVDEGKLDLDAPVAEVLPELQLADADVAKTVTMRQLLSHTSGIDGDVFTDTGRGDDCVEKYVGLLSESSRTTRSAPPGRTATPASSLAGRVIEKLTGRHLGRRAAGEAVHAARPDAHRDAAGGGAAVPRRGRARRASSGAEPVLAPVWRLPRSLGPAGLICSTPADVLAFARMHLTGGLAADGTRVPRRERRRR